MILRRTTRRPGRLLAPAWLLALAVAASGPAHAANPCADGGAEAPGSTGGIGGTGRSADTPGGISGTGRSGDETAQAPGGIAGTGRAEGPGDGGIGGTGRSGDAPSGINGTGRSGDETAQAPGGIAGTGRAEGPGDGGIGGTGRSGDVPGGIGGTGYERGLLGTVTGYASLCVSGVEVQVDSSALGDGGSLPAIGETVEVLGDGDGDVVRARTMARRPLLIGPIEVVRRTDGTMRVLGQEVLFDSSTRSASGSGDVAATLAGFSDGDLVRVSGLRNAEGRVVASRIDRAESGEVVLTGPARRVDARTISVGGTAVDVSALSGAAPADGDEVVVSGRLDSGRIVAGRMRDPFAAFAAGRVRRVDVETFVGSGRAMIAGRAAMLPAGAAITAGRARVAARVEAGGKLVIDAARPPVAWRPPGPLRGPRRDGVAPLPPGQHHRPGFPERPLRPEFPDKPPPRPPHRPPPPPPPPPPPRLR